MNKTIYLTYKKNVPEKVFDRWTELNPNYKIDFSLDDDCISFLKDNFNEYISDLFINIPIGMYKADLWRLCKLYINGGVYADVDLIPYINIDELLENDKNTFYSCLSIDKGSIFQAFMIVTKPKHPLLLLFILSFILNKPYLQNNNGPCYDMYKCLKYNINHDNNDIKPEIKYKLNQVIIKIPIGNSNENIKLINLYYFPNDINYKLVLNNNWTDDEFDLQIINNILIVKRLDDNKGWGYMHHCNIIIDSNESFFILPELKNNNWVNSYVSYNNKKILDSRDMDYYNNGKCW
jgi:hypothetical protein